jgi:WD repeat-containing protein 19
MDRKTILLYNLDDPENALELAFQQRYGHIVAFKWFRDGYVMVGFSLGYLVVISTRMIHITSVNPSFGVVGLTLDE